ncbi:MAG: sulfite exporter TauE/SafE family protein [Ruminococcaceae bacterium]|nr:sulfite exporter TauE/SafE family protein [Oscillospiraceae bacterium]
MWGALFGFLSGIVSGMGIGGGVILIPLLAIFLHTNQQPAQGINLFYFLPTAVSALVIHWKNEQIDFRPALTLMACAIPGAIVGGWIAVTISAGLLRKLFAFFLLLMGIHELFLKKEKENEKNR